MKIKIKSHHYIWIKSFVIIPTLAILLMGFGSFIDTGKSNTLSSEIEVLKTEPAQAIKAADNKEIKTLKLKPSVKKVKDTIPDKDLVVVASPEKMNIFYIGVDNPVSIAVGGVPIEKVSARIEDGGSIIGEKGNYIVRVKGPSGGRVKLMIYVDSTVVSVKEFRVKRVPDPRPRIIGIENKNEFTKEELLEAGGVEVYLPNFDFDLKFTIVGFNLSAVKMDGHAEDARSNSAEFTSPQTNLISQMQPGKKVYIEDVMVRSPDGSIVNIGSITITIK
jgi:gliding motility-associated protein GldM